MTAKKNPGLGARMGPIEAALAASRATSTPSESSKSEDAEPIATLSVRLPKSTHDALRRIVFEEGNRGNRVSIHSLMLEGIDRIIREKVGAGGSS